MTDEEIQPVEDVIAAEKLLSNALGGWRGLLDSGLPTALFIIIYTVDAHELRPALIAAAIVAGALAVVRLIERKSLQQVGAGLIGVLVAGYVTAKTGKAENFFLPGLLTNAAYGLGVVISILLKMPVLGFIVGALTGDITGWRNDPDKLKFFSLLSWWWAGMFFFRLVVEVPLYLANQLELLGTAKILLGYPLYLSVIWVTYRSIKARDAATRG